MKERLEEIKRDSRKYGKLSDPPIFFREVEENDFKWLIEQAEQNKRYQEALEEIGRGRFPGASYKARKALEGESDG